MPRLRVLVHSPQPASLAGLVAALAEGGFEVSGTNREAEALSKLQAGEYDLLVLTLPRERPGEEPWTLVMLRIDRNTSLAVPTPLPRPLITGESRPETLSQILRQVKTFRDSAEAGKLLLLHKVGEGVAAESKAEETVSRLVEGLGKLTTATVWLLSPGEGESWKRVSSGELALSPFLEGLGRQVLEKGQPLLMLEAVAAPPEWQREFIDSGVGSAFILPLKVAGRGVGTVAFLRRGGNPFTNYDVQLASLFLPLLGLAVENWQLRQQAEGEEASTTQFQEQLERRQREIRALNSLLQNQQAKLVELEEAHRQAQGRFLATLSSLANFIETGNPGKAGRSEAVARQAVSLAEAVGVPMEGLAEAAYLHDLGMFWPQPLGREKEALSAEEQKQLLKHPFLAGQVAQALGLPVETKLVLEHHHENYDGSGYPDGLTGEKIPVAARLLRVADAYTDLVSPLPPAPPLLPAQALAKLKSGVGQQYDPKMVAALEKQVGDKATPEAEMMSTVSHELRSPLTFLVGYSELLAGQQDLPPSAKEKAQEIHSEVLHMSKLVQDLLQVSRYETGRVELQRREVELGEVIKRAATKARAKSARQQVEVRLPPAPLVVKADRDKILEVLDNLLDNAINYSPEGGPIFVTGEKDKQEVIVSVSDQGIGIPKEKQGLLFQKFYRVDSPLKAQVAGTGLGLNLCKHIVESHGGRIWVESEEGKGSTFAFALPL